MCGLVEKVELAGHGREKEATKEGLKKSNRVSKIFSDFSSFIFFFFFVFFYFILSELLNQRARSATPSPLPPNPNMAHPGADYDPYDGIVSNPNKKKNPLVLVGAFETNGVDRRKACRDENLDNLDLDCSRLFSFLSLPSSLPHKTQARSPLPESSSLG